MIYLHTNDKYVSGEIWESSGLPKDKLANGQCVMDGHDSGSTYWIYPVRVHALECGPGLGIEKIGREISISSSFFERYMLSAFRENFNPQNMWNRKRLARILEEDENYSHYFKTCSEENLYTYEEMENILCGLEDDFSAENCSYPAVTDTITTIAEKIFDLMATFSETNMLSVVGP